MPIYKYFGTLEVARGIKAFLRLEGGLTRGEAPNPEQNVRQLQRRQKQRSASEARRGVKTHIAGDARDHYIGRVVRGKSFADVGSLYDTVGEKVSVAHSFGAAPLTMINTVPQDDKLWQSFSDRMRYFGIAEFDAINKNPRDLINAPNHTRYDVVHYSGVLHHMSDPKQFLSALHRITREYLVLGCVVAATRANGREKSLEVPSATSLPVSALRERGSEAVEDHQRPFIDDDAVNPTPEETSWEVNDFASGRWFPTADSLRAMCRSVGFNYEDVTYHNNTYIVLLSR